MLNALRLLWILKTPTKVMGPASKIFIHWHASKRLLATSPYAAEPLMVGESRLKSANVRFRNLALGRSRNWTVTANDRYVDADPVSGLAATVRNRRKAVTRPKYVDVRYVVESSRSS